MDKGRPQDRATVPRSDTTAVGRRGEQRAWEYLEHRGWRLLARNYRAGAKEIDLIVERGGVVAFVEVKTRRTATGGGPLDTIDGRKQREVYDAARHWITRFGAPHLAYRFDAVAVTRAGGVWEVLHIPDAWRRAR